MRNNYRSKKFKNWLDTLQQESWQLELLISGFAIFGLIQVFEPLEIRLNIAQNTSQDLLIPVYVLALNACAILVFTLLFHIILRGLWIGALGLRYVSGDIDFKKLNYSPKFDRYLRKRIGSFDKYISKLEDGCSVLFALSFLLIFYILSLAMFIISIFLIGYFIIGKAGGSNKILLVAGGTLIFILLFGMLLVFIDFLTQGFLKKKKWLSAIYFPFYWIFSYITLSFLYRPLVYNFLDNRFGKILSLALVPVYFGMIYLTSIQYTRSNFMSVESNSSEIFANSENYETILDKENGLIDDASIPSKVISTNYLPVFIEYKDIIEDRVFEFNEGLKPENDRRGFHSEVNSNDNNISRAKRDSLRIEYMKVVKELHIIKIDSTTCDYLDYVFTRNKNNQEGFETVISLDSIATGKHSLNIYRKNRKEENEDGTYNVKIVANIPFWYYPK